MDWIQKFIDMMFPVEENSPKTEEAYLLKHKNLPKSLFKYRSINSNSIINFIDDRVWLSNPHDFNDPYDCAFTVNFNNADKLLLKNDNYRNFLRERHVPENILGEMELSDFPSDVLRERCLEIYPEENRIKIKEALTICKDRDNKMLEQFVPELKDSFKICCFSERNDSMLMWSHYADFHRGFCLEYDISALPVTDLRSCLMFPVIYAEKLTDVTSDLLSTKPNHLSYRLAAMTKSVDWAYEQEWRLIFPNRICEGKGREIPMPTPKALYLGCNITQDRKYDILVKTALKKGIPVYKMLLSNSEFKMVASKYL